MAKKDSIVHHDDDAHLAAVGHKQELKRHFSPLAMLGLAFAILNSWTALSASLSLALPSGGPTSVIWVSKPVTKALAFCLLTMYRASLLLVSATCA